jgi:hypothetical protein
VNTLQHFGLWDATNGDQGQVLAMVYRYDQLNRLRKARGVIGLASTNTWHGVADSGPNEDNRYRSEYTFDANGNIETVQRYDGAGTGHYDSFAYHYHTSGGRKQQNRLYELIDAATMNTGSDIVTTATGFDNTPNGVNANNNYGYDALGNLVRDDREDIELIHWTVAGKVDSIQRPGTSTRSPLKFRYGASGQRVSKQVGDFYATEPGAYREHYIRDAQGNIMATYRYTNTGAASLKLNERPLYGSSRLGSLRTEVELHTLASFDPASANPVQMVDLNYELTDHLGNVCAVVTGRLLDGNGGGTAKQAELVSAQGYEPFGSLLPGRNYSTDSYSFGFNGQNKDSEVYGSEGSSYTAEFWQYDSRLTRRFNLDPKPNPAISPYETFGLNPIYFIDILGDTIRGVDAASGSHMLSTIRNSFSNQSVKELFTLASDGKTMSSISESAFVEAVKNVGADEQQLAYSYFRAINGTDVHTVEMTERDKALSGIAKDLTGLSLGSDIDKKYGGGVNISVKGGSFSVIVLNSKANIADYSIVHGGIGLRSSPEELFAHEVLGHGSGRALGSTTHNHIDAIQMTNLYLRSAGEHVTYRTGTGHGTRQLIPKSIANEIPAFNRMPADLHLRVRRASILNFTQP